MDDVICMVCNAPIFREAEQIDRVYKLVGHPVLRLNGRKLGARKHHDDCDATFAAEKTHLAKVVEV